MSNIVFSLYIVQDDTVQVLNPSPAEPRYALSLQTV